MNIDFPTAAQIPQLKALWKNAFGDGDDFLDPFFRIAYAPERCRCITEGDRLAAALYWFDTFCGDQRFAYVYAVATDPVFQHRGLCRALMEDTKNLLRKQGYHGILLYPASAGLSQMYAKMGYTHCTTAAEFETDAAGSPAALRQISKAEYARLRRALLPPVGVVQEGPMLDFFASQVRFCAGDDWVAAVSADGDRLHCHELLGNIAAAAGIVRALDKKCGFFRTWGPEKPFVMILPLVKNCTNPVYFGLPLD